MLAGAAQEIVHQAVPGLAFGEFFFEPAQKDRNPRRKTVLFGELMPKGTERRIDQHPVDEGIGKLAGRRSENFLYGEGLKLHPKKYLSLGRLELYRHGIEAVDKTIRYAILPVADPGKDGKTVIQVKNDLYHALGYDEFFVQGRMPFHLPNGLDAVAETRGRWYVQTVDHMRGLFVPGRGNRQKSRLKIRKKGIVRILCREKGKGNTARFIAVCKGREGIAPATIV